MFEWKKVICDPAQKAALASFSAVYEIGKKTCKHENNEGGNNEYMKLGAVQNFMKELQNDRLTHVQYVTKAMAA
jgi:hypothetical protein